MSRREREKAKASTFLPCWLIKRKKIGGKKLKNQKTPFQRPFTVYTVRFRTSSSRDAEPDDPEAGVLLCLIAENGDAVIRRVSRVADPQADADDAAEACAAAGAACDAAGFKAVAALERAAARSSSTADGEPEESEDAAAAAAPPPPCGRRGSGAAASTRSRSPRPT